MNELDLADLALLSRRAWINDNVNKNHILNLNGVRKIKTKQLQKPKQVPIKSRSAPLLLNQLKSERSSTSLSRSQSTPRHDIRTNRTASQQIPHATALQSIIALANLASEPTPKSMRERKFAHLPSEIHKIDKSMKERNEKRSALAMDVKLRQSKHLLQKLNHSIKAEIQNKYFINSIDPNTKRKLRKNIRLKMIDQHKWSMLLRKCMRSTMKEHRTIHENRQKQWIVIVLHIKWLMKHYNRWQDILANRKIETARNVAISKLQGGWRTTYSKRMDIKHQRTYELLKRRAWIARLNVRTRQRSNNGLIVRNFLLSYANSSRFSKWIKLFKWRVIRIQRATRRWFKIRSARLMCILKLFDKYEKDVLIDMEISKRNAEIEIEKLKNLRRMSVEMNIDMNTLKIQMKEMERLKLKKEKEDALLSNNDDHFTCKTRKRPKSAIPPVNVRLKSKQSKQVKIYNKCKNLIDTLNERDQIIYNDINMKNETINLWKYNSSSSRGGGGGSSSSARKLAPGMRNVSSGGHINGKVLVLGPLAVAKANLLISKQKKQILFKRLRKEKDDRHINKRTRKASNAYQKRLNVVSRYEPLPKLFKRRIILDWLSKSLRETWKEYEMKCEELQSTVTSFTMLEMKQIMDEKVIDSDVEDEDERKEQKKGNGDNNDIDESSNSMNSLSNKKGGVVNIDDGKKDKESTESLLAETLNIKMKPRPIFLFPLFSEFANVEEIKLLIQNGHRKQIEFNEKIEHQNKRRVRTSSYNKTKNSTLRHWLGDELINTITGFIDT
jgi:hypothetical protein